MGKQWRNEDIIFPEDAQRWEDGVEQSLKENDQNAEDLKKHNEDKNNPHGVTAAQAGAYTKAETDSRDAAILQTAKAHTDTHESRKNNPHGVTAAQTGAYTKAESNANDQEILTTAKQYTDEKKAEATTFTSQEVAKVKTEIQNGNVASATKLQASRKIAGVDFDGTKDIAIPAGNVGAYTKTEADTKVATAKSEVIGGNVASATKLQTARTINGVAFDGTRNIDLLADPQVSEIPANANLNNYKNAGFYGCRLSATAETVSNTPTTVAFSLVVLNAGNESIVTQLLSEFNTPAGSKLYIRRCYNNSWGGWHPIATADGTLQSGLFAQSASRLAAARTISLTGGVTGSVAFDGTANVSLAATVPPNSHAHTIANVTGLQTALDGKTNVRGHSNGTVTQISNVNLNDFVESGVFMGSTMTNAPDTGWWYIQNMVHNANYVTQVAYRLNSTDQRIRIRIKNNGTWQAWQTCMLSTDNAPTATRLATPRTISLTGGVTGSTTFDGSGNASIAATVAGNAPSASRLATPRTISLTGGATGSVSFDGSNNVSLATTLSGNAPSATRLATARSIALSGVVTGSVNFDGSSNVTLNTNNSGLVALTGNQTVAGLKNFSTVPQAGGVNLARVSDVSSPMRGTLTGTITWNSITEPGLYYCNNITNKADLTSAYGHLEVMNHSGTTSLTQRYTDVNGTTIQRSFHSSGWSGWRLVAYDSGWTNLAFADPFRNYNSTAGNVPRLRRTVNTVEFRGIAEVVRNTPTTDAAIGLLTANLVSWAIPDTTVYELQQGTAKRTWLLTVYDTGRVACMRYGTTAYEAIPVGHWLPFHATWTSSYSAGI